MKDLTKYSKRASAKKESSSRGAPTKNFYVVFLTELNVKVFHINHINNPPKVGIHMG
jgi:hypothetical protein